MAKRFTKRKKRLYLAILLSFGFIGIVFMIFYFALGGKKVYTPGEEIEGLTSELARNLPEDFPKVTFTDVTSQAGIQFEHFSGERTTQLPEDMGSGIAWGDYDLDGWEDIFIANFSGPITLSNEELKRSAAHSRLYRNNRDGTFTDVSAETGLNINDWANGVAWGDYNNDGRPDLFVSCYGKNLLFENKVSGVFVDVSEKSGIAQYEGYWTGISWSDYNLDGNIDIYVCGYVNYQPSDDRTVSLQYNAEVPASINPSSFPPIANLLFHNNGDGTFTEVAAEAKVQNETGRSLAVAWCDFDADGLPDIYVANDVSDNALFRNNGDGTFSDVSYTSFVADYRGAMGIGTGDWDNDGDFDMFITHWMAQENALYNNLLSQLNTRDISANNRLKFMDEADRWGLGQIALEYIGFSTFFFDYNNDGMQDIFVTNGSTFQQRDNPKLLIPMKDKLFWNRGPKEGFFDVSDVSGQYFKESFVGRGAAYADYDQDGDLDIFVNNNTGTAKLLRNDGGNAQNWLDVKLSQKAGNRDALGSMIRIVYANNTQVQQIGAQGPYFSQNSLTAHFGLGSASVVDTLEVYWPDARKEIHTHVAVNKFLALEKE